MIMKFVLWSSLRGQEDNFSFCSTVEEKSHDVNFLEFVICVTTMGYGGFCVTLNVSQ